MDTVYQKVHCNSFLLLFLRYGIQKTTAYSAQVRLHCVLLKENNFCIMNKIKLVWFYSL